MPISPRLRVMVTKFLNLNSKKKSRVENGLWDGDVRERYKCSVKVYLTLESPADLRGVGDLKGVIVSFIWPLKVRLILFKCH